MTKLRLRLLIERNTNLNEDVRRKDEIIRELQRTPTQQSTLLRDNIELQKQVNQLEKTVKDLKKRIKESDEILASGGWDT